ncbi:hypothetical protein DUNSADRAFT_15094, partial [Dunaliella salina]
TRHCGAPCQAWRRNHGHPHRCLAYRPGSGPQPPDLMWFLGWPKRNLLAQYKTEDQHSKPCEATLSSLFLRGQCCFPLQM